MNLIDSHAHLEAVENLEEALYGAKRAGVSKIIAIGTSIESSTEAANLALSKSSNDLEIYATCGIHPGDGRHNIEKFGVDGCIDKLRAIITSRKKIVGVGEAGLDFFADTTKEEKEYQMNLLQAQVKLADEFRLPLVVHCRNAWDDIFDAISKLKGQNSKLAGVFHSFTGGIGEAKKAVGLGFYISFSGIVTFKQSLRSSQAAGLKNTENIRAAAKWVPIDKILVETDSPYLAPEPIRGQKNKPENVRIVADSLSDLKNIRSDIFYAQVSRNSHSLFKI